MEIIERFESLVVGGLITAFFMQKNSPQNMRTKFIYENYRYCDII